MNLTNVLIDINICLDSALQRRPFAVEAGKILSLSENKNISGFVAAHSLDTIFYVLSKNYNTTQCYKAIKAIRETVQIAPVTQSIIDEAIEATWNDFEDAIQYHCAKENGCDAIITRNRKDFTESELPILSPRAFLEQIQSNESE